jgi:pilus assembly protein CpaB
MKKNVLPLVVIALVVAVLSTGVFYGLIVSRMDGSAKTGSAPRYIALAALAPGQVLKPSDYQLSNVEDPGYPSPVRPEDLNGRTVKIAIEAGKVIPEGSLDKLGRPADPNGIPSGYRAVTLHISESSSVFDLLSPGDHVDVLALITRNRGGEQDLESTVLLQNATVLDLRKDTTQQNLQGRQILTVLVTPQDAQRVSVADAGARLRIALRNKKDSETHPQTSTSISSLLKGQPAASLRPVIQSNFTPGPPVVKPAKPVELEVSLLEVSPEQAESVAPGSRQDVLAVASSGGSEAANKLDRLKLDKRTNLLASRRFSVDRAGEFSWLAEDQSSLRIRVEALARTNEGLQLRVQPESTSTVGANATTQRLDSNVRLAEKQSAIVTGLLPGNKQHPGHLMVVISPVQSQ